MSEHLHRARLFEPYSELSGSEIEMINVLVQEKPCPAEVENALNGLLERLFEKFPTFSVGDARNSIANAAMEVSPALAHLPRIHRSKEARRLVKRCFEGNLEGADSDGAPGDDHDPLERERTDLKRKGNELEL